MIAAPVLSTPPLRLRKPGNRVIAQRWPLPHGVANCGQLQAGDTIIVSFVGRTDWPNPHIFADSGVRYDWSFMAGLAAVLCVRQGVDITHALREIVRFSEPWPTLVDQQARTAGNVGIDNAGRMCPVTFPKGSWLWRQYFT